MARMEDRSDCITALTWRPEGCRKAGRPRTTRRRTVGKKGTSWGGVPGTKLNMLPEQPRELSGKSALQCYGLGGSKRTGEVRRDVGHVRTVDLFVHKTSVLNTSHGDLEV